MIHLLLLSKEGRWARDQLGNHWVLQRGRPFGTNVCVKHPVTPGGRTIPEGDLRWVAQLPGAPTMYGPGLHETAVCQACADVQHPIERASA